MLLDAVVWSKSDSLVQDIIAVPLDNILEEADTYLASEYMIEDHVKTTTSADIDIPNTNPNTFQEISHNPNF